MKSKIVIFLWKLYRQMFGEANKGRLDYYRFPHWRDSWGGPFNGQKKRQELFEAIASELKPIAVIETGTYRGTTTLHLCRTGLPVYTVEGLARNYGFAKSQLRRCKNVTALNCDSRRGLKELISGPLKDAVHEVLFFYLDAHWNADLPLEEELEIILLASTRPVIMIDDFEVAGDDGYGYDDYGGSSVLNYDYIAAHVEKHGLKRLYPAAPSSAETGAKRGSIILCKETDAASLLKTGLFRSV